MATGPTRTPDDDPNAPEWWRRSATLRRLPLIVILVLVVIALRALQGGGSAPSITANCTTPDFVMSAATAARHHVIDYSVTGPPGMRYLLMVGVSGFVSSDNELIGTPDYGLAKDQTQAASQRKTMEADCVQTGRFGVLVPPGAYAVRLFRLEGPSGNMQAVDVASHQLVVTS